MDPPGISPAGLGCQEHSVHFLKAQTGGWPRAGSQGMNELMSLFPGADVMHVESTRSEGAGNWGRLGASGVNAKTLLLPPSPESWPSTADFLKLSLKNPSAVAVVSSIVAINRSHGL